MVAVQKDPYIVWILGIDTKNAFGTVPVRLLLSNALLLLDISRLISQMRWKA